MPEYTVEFAEPHELTDGDETTLSVGKQLVTAVNEAE